MKNICVFCGSAKGSGDSYIELARELGKSIVKNNFGLVYGGASIGVMGAIADEVLSEGGEVIGIMPKSLVNWEVGHEKITKFEVVDGMHERKQKMYDYSDVILAIPGGMGTLDELCEIVTWAQLQYHRKPIFLINHRGFYNHFLAHLDHAVTEGFLKPHHRNLIKTVDTVEAFFNNLEIK